MKDFTGKELITFKMLRANVDHVLDVFGFLFFHFYDSFIMH